jgi:hypothetical protein
MSAHRSTGTWCITIKNTHQAWRFSPYVTVPGAPAASGGGPATWAWPHAHCTSCRSCWMISARASGRSVTWWEYRTPRSRAPARFLPHPQVPSGKCGMVSSGRSLHGRYAPGAPGCLPGLRFFPPCRCPGCGVLLPGWSSLLGGIEELPLLREISRSSRAICSACSASCARRPAITSSLSSFSRARRSTASRSRAFSARSSAAPGPSAVPGTPVLHHGRPQYANRHHPPASTTLSPHVT